MKLLILTLGILSLGLGLMPEPSFTPIKKELRVHKVIHMKCAETCTITDKEM